MPHKQLGFDIANFSSATFSQVAQFQGAQFQSVADFYGTHFQDTAQFLAARFKDTAVIANATFESACNFQLAVFDSICSFAQTTFQGDANFRNVTFKNNAHFLLSHFKAKADFSWSHFLGQTDLSAIFEEGSSFIYCRFFGPASVRVFRSATPPHLDFYGATLADTIEVGGTYDCTPSYDFTKTIFLEPGETRMFFAADTTRRLRYPGARIIMMSPADVKMQLEKFQYLDLGEQLDYYWKKDMITTLKEISFKGDEYKRERFELDYIFQKSTMFQKPSASFIEFYPWWNPIVWWRWLYNATMGLGYRPFRIIWWALGIMLLGTFFFFAKMGKRIDEYIAATYRNSTPAGPRGAQRTRFETFLNCAYFSVMLFFTFRFKGNLLTFFDAKEKKFIITEWLLGLCVYIAFLYHTSSVLQNIRSLFVGG